MFNRHIQANNSFPNACICNYFWADICIISNWVQFSKIHWNSRVTYLKGARYWETSHKDPLLTPVQCKYSVTIHELV